MKEPSKNDGTQIWCNWYMFKNKKLEAENKELWEFAWHKDGCPQKKLTNEDVCTCGLNKLFRKYG